MSKRNKRKKTVECYVHFLWKESFIACGGISKIATNLRMNQPKKRNMHTFNIYAANILRSLFFGTLAVSWFAWALKCSRLDSFVQLSGHLCAKKSESQILVSCTLAIRIEQFVSRFQVDSSVRSKLTKIKLLEVENVKCKYSNGWK